MRSWEIVILLCLIAACKKEPTNLGQRSAPTLDTPLSLFLDSTCVKAPNFITANSDGINDRFNVIHYEPLQSFSLIITNPNGNIVYTVSSPQHSWNGYDVEFIDESGPIPYVYTIELITMSGNAHSVSKVVHVIRDIFNECISSDVQPEAGDQYDPRMLCGFLYPTNDFVCIE